MKRIKYNESHKKDIQKIHSAVSDLVCSINTQIYDLVMESRFKELNDWLFENEYDIKVDTTLEAVALFHKDKEINRIMYGV